MIWWFAALSLVAIVFVLWPLLETPLSKKHPARARDDLEQHSRRRLINDALYQEQRHELQRDFEQGIIDRAQFQKLDNELQLLHDNDTAAPETVQQPARRQFGLVVAIGSALLIPLIAGSIYWRHGAAADWEIQQLDTQLSHHVAVNGFDKRAETMTQELRQRLQNRLEQKPDNLNNWYLLANTTFQLGDYMGSINAYTKILERRPNSPGVMANLVQVMYIGSGNRMTAPVKELFDKALAADPQNTTLLGLGGADAYQRGNFSEAVRFWRQALQSMNPRDPKRAIWQDAITQAQNQMAPGEASAEGQVAGPAIDVAVSLADHVRAEATDRVFVFARAWQGPPMPLAVADLTVADLPTTVRLDQSNSMMGNTIQADTQVELVARISSTGTQAPQSGEWEATAGPISVSDKGVNVALVIQSQRP